MQDRRRSLPERRLASDRVAPPPGDMIRVLVVDDHAVVRAGVHALLDQVEDMVVVGEAWDGASAIQRAMQVDPDVILMDLVMPGTDGIHAITTITHLMPDIRILALTSFSSDDKLFPALRAGAHGYLLKDTEPKDLIHAIRETHRGESCLHPGVARKVLQHLHQASDPQAGPPQALSEREREVLGLIAKGLTNREIAEAVGLSEATVRTHVSNILSKLNVSNRVQAALHAWREGVAEGTARSRETS